MKRKAAVALTAIAVVVAGCGGGDDSDGGDDSTYTRDEVANALGLYNKHHEVIYERAPGKDCIVLRCSGTRMRSRWP